MSVSEKVLWSKIRRRQLGFQFKRQVPVGPYVLDFYCAEAGLCVEVDGEQHREREWADRRRDEFLLSKSIETLRIPSLDLFDGGGEFRGEWLDRIEFECRRRVSERLK